MPNRREIGPRTAQLSTMLTANGTGKCIHARVARFKESTWLEVTIAVEDTKGDSVRIIANNRNGLLRDFQEQESLVVGRHIAFSGSIVNGSISDSYCKDGQKTVRSRKVPEMKLSYAFLKRIPVLTVEVPVEREDTVTPVSQEPEETIKHVELDVATPPF